LVDLLAVPLVSRRGGCFVDLLAPLEAWGSTSAVSGLGAKANVAKIARPAATNISNPIDAGFIPILQTLH
jgi:hypothetical protein